MNINELQQIFEQAGGTFVSPALLLEAKVKKIKALIFDWDGVFNTGNKSINQSSPYGEADSMGTNMLRFSFHLVGQLPYIGIVTGEENPTASAFARREHFNAVYFKIKHKIEAVNEICAQTGIELSEVAFVFDDVLDLSVAEKCGVRILINRTAGPLFKKFVSDNGLCDYITGAQGGNHAVREASELMMGLLNNHDLALTHRMHQDETYLHYLSLRNQSETTFYKKAEAGFESVHIG